MSRPFQFTDKDDISNSPLDRRPQNPYPQGQPPSFKTNVNRAKTKKWVEAKQVSYGGDDWDDYDEDDEYGVSSAVDERPPPMASSSQNRSFTTPIPGSAQASQLHRTNSFERGDERRAFSSTNHPVPAAPRSPGPPLHVDTGVPARQVSVTDSASQYSQSAGATRQVSSASFAPSAVSDNTNPENRRDFSPSAMPQPLKTPATAMSPTDATPLSPASAAKARTFVRPSDIYKRMEEEREKERRASLDSTRRSMDSNTSRSQELPQLAPVPQEPVPEPRMESGYRMGAPLETVAERKSEYGMPQSKDSSKPGFSGLSLPAFESNDNFGDFWDEASKAKEAEQAAAAQAPADANLQHQPSVGYRSMVNQAFDAPAKVSKQDSTRSHAATESSGITRSDTSGTSDISPIMSRVPSSAASAMKQAEHRDAPPAIAEEPELDERGRARRSAESATLADIQPGYRRSLNPPSGTNSPARSPVVESRNPLHDPVAAELLTSPASDKVADSSFREADLASAASSSPSKPNAPVAALEKAAQDNFIVTQNLPAEASSNISRSESPTKGRVADLAGKFNEVSTDSRRNSQQSIKSASSWDSSSRPTSSHGQQKATERPVAEREISFRPKLPGGFESYASTSRSRSASPVKASQKEIEPTTAKQPLESKDVSSQGTTSSSGGPMAALAAAGAAIAASIQGTTGSDSAGKDATGHGRATGDIWNRPLPPDRMESTASSIPPTPPVKDEPISHQPPPVLTKDLPQPPRLEHRDTAESTDFESDRLRRDIVRSLSPTQEDKPAGSSTLEVPSNRAPNRQSNTILSEYESYWAGSDDEEEPKMSASALPSVVAAPLPLKPSKSVELPAEPVVPVQKEAPPVPAAAAQNVPSYAAPPPQAPNEPAAQIPSPTSASTAASARPGFLTQRFSWEVTPADSPVKETPPAAQAAAKAPESAVTATPTSAPARKSSELKPNDPLSLNPKLSSEHLQIRNAEPGELPSPEEARGPSLDSIREFSTPRLVEEGPLSPPGDNPVSPMMPVSPVVPTPTRDTPAGPRPLSGHKPQHEGHDIRPPSFREILAIKATDVRIAKYNETRLQFANMDTGLENWLRATMTTNPELGDVNSNIPAHRPTMPPTITTSSPGGARHKATASLTKVFSGQGDKLEASTPEQHRPSPTSGGSAAALKGKEFMSQATKLGGKGLGKGMKEAKGLFAKGKSRFRTSGSEKAHFEPSPLTRRPSLASSVSSRSSSVFSASSSRRSSIDSLSLGSRRASLDTALMTSTCPFSTSPLDEMCPKADPEAKKPRDTNDDDESNANDNDCYNDVEPFWSDGWLRENVDFTVMAIFKRNKKGKGDDTKPVFGRPDAESDPELAKNTMMNRQRPTTPGQQQGQGIPAFGGKQGDSMAPALPQFAFEGKPGSRPTSRNSGLPEPPPKGGIMKHPNSSGSLAPPGSGGGRAAASSPLAGGGATGPARKMGDRNSHARIVSMMAPGDEDDDEDPPSPVSPVDEEEQKLPPATNGRDALGRSNNLRAVSSTTKLPPLNTQTGGASLAPTISMGSPMLRPNSHIGIGGAVVDSPSRPRVSFQPPEPKGKEKAVAGVSTPTGGGPKHLRFDSSTFNDKGKEPKKVEEKPSSAKKFAPSLIIPRFGGGRGRGTPTTETPTEKGGLETPTAPFGRGRGRGGSGTSTPRSNLAPPPSAMKSRPNGPETGQLTPRGRGAGLQRADSQFDRMAAIANAHRMMREQFDEVHGVSETPPDLVASEAAARMAGQTKEHDKLSVPGVNGKAIAPIAEEDSGSVRTGRSRASSAASIQSDNRSRSRESRPNAGYGHQPQDSRSSSMPRYAGSGARASSIPRPESIVGGDRRQSWGSGATTPEHKIGVAITTPMLTISKGQSPVTAVSSSSLGGLPSQQRRMSGQAEPRLSAGPGPTIRSESPASQSGRATPSMVITSPDSSPRKLSQQVSVGRQSQRSVSSMGDAPDQSTRVSTADSKRSVSPVRRSVERQQAGAPLERPMSYIMSDRDEQGFISEVISTGRKPGEVDDDDTTSGASPAVDQKTLNRLMGESSDRSGQTSRTSLRSDDDDDLYKQPSPKVVPVSSNELDKETSTSRPTSKTEKHRSVQLYDRPFSRDESTSGTSTPSQQFVTPQAEPDANPIAHLQSPQTPAAGKKGGLLAKLKGKPGPGSAVAASGHSQNSSRDTTNTSSEEQRLSSMTSTTASVQSDVKEKKGRRGSGFFSLKRPSSTEPLMMKDDTTIPPHNQVRINTNVPPAASPVSAGATPRRSATSVEPTKKRRGTLGALFSRGGSSTPTSQQAPPVPQKPSAKNTIFHRVPTNPPSSSSSQGFQGPRDTGSTTPGGHGSRPPSAGNRPPSFVHQPGAAGHAAINAQAQSGITTHISSDARRERRSMSLTGSGGLFGRKRAGSTESTTRDRSNSIESQSKLKKWRKGSKGSINGVENIQHQERPWAITLPGAEDNDPQAKEIERAEIMHAASNRWQRGADGQMYPLTEQSPNSMSNATPISPRHQQVPAPQDHQGRPQAPRTFSFEPQQRPGPESRDAQSPDFYSPQTRLPPPASYPARPTPYRPGHDMGRDPEKPAIYDQPTVPPPSQPVIPPLQQPNVPLMQPQPRRTSWQADANDPRMDPSYRSQGGAASRSTTTTASTSTSPRVAQNPNVGSPRSPRMQVPAQPRQVDNFSRPHRSPTNSRDGPPAQEKRPSVPMKDPQHAARVPSRGKEQEGAAVESQNFVAALEAERRKHGEHTGMGASSSKGRRAGGGGLHVNVPVTSGAPPPQVGVFSDTTAAVASTGLGARRSRRDKGEASDDDEDSAPVMKATSFPGDEWVPEFYYE